MCIFGCIYAYHVGIQEFCWRARSCFSRSRRLFCYNAFSLSLSLSWKKDSWKPEFASEGISNIETRQYQAKGTVSAAGITVDTSNRVVTQCLDVTNSVVTNEVGLDWGRVCVAGPFRPSEMVPNRAIVAFNRASITVGKSLTLELGFFFDILAALRGSKDTGWLETTYIDEDMRIGRGDKGTMFVLTRDVNAVQP